MKYLENYTIEFPNKNLEYMEDIFDYFIERKAIINQYESIYSTSSLEVSNEFFKDLKELFLQPLKYLKSKTLSKIARDVMKGDLLVLEVDFKMSKYDAYKALEILGESYSESINVPALLEPYLVSQKHYLLKFTKQGMTKFLLESFKDWRCFIR